MLSFSIEGDHVKDFMQHLFTHGTFCSFEARGIVVHSFTCFHISGEKVVSANDNSRSPDAHTEPDSQAEPNRHPGHCTWEEIRPYVRHIIKGKEKPRAMKIIFAHSSPETLHPSAAALFINVTYEGGSLSCTTASSQKQFALDKAVDMEWDSWVQNFFTREGISYSNP